MTHSSTIEVKVIPRARKTESMWQMDDGTEKIRIKAIPEDGKANEELIRFLSEREPWTRWEIIGWKTSTKKRLRKNG